VWHIRSHIESEKGYTCAAGVSTSKLLSKLVGNLHKPRDQTTLLPPYVARGDALSSVTYFLDQHEIGKLPGIGFKTAAKLREFALVRAAEEPPVDCEPKVEDGVTVKQLRSIHGMNEGVLERLLGGPGAPSGIGTTIFNLINGVDDSEVAPARGIPKQISIEDSYSRLATLEEAAREMKKLSRSLLQRMRVDLVEHEGDSEDASSRPTLHWLARPRMLRLSTRPRAPLGPDGTRVRSSGRISRSVQMPSYVFSFTDAIDVLAERLVAENLLPLFGQLHPAKTTWDLSLINVAATNMQEMAGEGKFAAGRDIFRMFQNQTAVLGAFRVVDAPSRIDEHSAFTQRGSEDNMPLSQQTQASANMDAWEEEDEDSCIESSSLCPVCGASMPPFAMAAHERFHQEERGR
jgi:DNA polymerase iota